VDIDRLKQRLLETTSLQAEGRVSSVTGLSVRMRLPGARIGEIVSIGRKGERLLAQVVGFEQGEVVGVPFGDLTGVGPDDPVASSGEGFRVRVGRGLLGRVLDGFGRPIDGLALPAELEWAEVDRRPPNALDRRPVDAALATGVRVIDALLTIGLGQRVGLFAGSGVGKSTLLGCIARGVRADVVVVALVGERGREVNEFIDQCLGPALARSVVVVATSDAPALERLKAAETATAIAESFRDRGQNVMLLVDSVTRYARALREVGLAAGEPPARRGYPPTVFAALPRLLERSGQAASGSITGRFTGLVVGDDLDVPIADEVRGTLDGHVVLSRAVAERGVYPAVDVPASLSRVMKRCVDEEHDRAAHVVRRAIAAYESRRDLVALGAYEKGGDVWVDRTIAAAPDLARLLEQTPREIASFDETKTALLQLARRFA
jgi:type III secretion protein N (ATPase)